MTKTEEILTALREGHESESAEGWLMVYLDNVRPDGMSDKSFRSHLAALSKQGLYRPVDGWAWGEVRKGA